MKAATNLHTCSIPGCETVLPVQFLMCKRHWRMVPAANRSEVWDAWDGWRCGVVSAQDLRDAQKKATDAVVARLPKGGGS